MLNRRKFTLGMGAVGVAAFHTASGWRWCFAGMGTGTGPIERAALSEPVSAPIAVRDGGFGRDVLMLVHHDRHTEPVVVDTARSRSVVLASASGFEVVLIPMASWRSRIWPVSPKKNRC